MTKKINAKTIKLLKFYNLINYNLIYNNKAINRYKKNLNEISVEKSESLEMLKRSISNLKNCELKKMQLILFLVMVILSQKLCLLVKRLVRMKIKRVYHLLEELGILLDKMLWQLI